MARVAQEVLSGLSASRQRAWMSETHAEHKFILRATVAYRCTERSWVMPDTSLVQMRACGTTSSVINGTSRNPEAIKERLSALDTALSMARASRSG